MKASDVPAIELSGISKRYAEVTAVRDFRVVIEKGEFFSLLGPSGCGKTTTLRVIAGLESPTEGSVFLEGKDVTGAPAYRRNVDTVFQDYALFPHMNVEKNIYFPLKMKRMSRFEAGPKIRRVLRLVNMEGFEHRMPQQLSGGQRNRIALARSLVNEPAAAFVASFIGDMNFLTGKVKTREGCGGTVEVAGKTARTDKAMGRIAPGDEALVCIRSEKVPVKPGSSKPGTRADNIFAGTVRRIVFRGSDYEVTCGVGGAELRAVVSATLWDGALREGGRVAVGFQSSDVIIFPRSEVRDVFKYEAAV
jgi:ABC-type Fe3+/spermidine/putrescine transport system ATPase subunit